MTTFKMPCLSRYKFDHEGNAYGNGKQLTARTQNGTWFYYAVIDNRGGEVRLGVKEVIAYGKHIKEAQIVGAMSLLKIPMQLVPVVSKKMPVRKRYGKELVI